MRGWKKILTGFAAVAAISSNAGANDYSVSLNQTELVHLPEPAGAIVIGNPEIADVSVHSADTLFVLGRGYGATNIIVLNAAGQTIMNANVHVGANIADGQVRIYNGSQDERRTYSCYPSCQPSPILGDAPGFVGRYKAASTPISNPFASGSSAPPPPPSANPLASVETSEDEFER